jgi:hypothetical protein
MKLLRNSGIAMSAVVFITTNSYAFESVPVSTTINNAQLSIPYTEHSIIIDADLSDPAWQQALEIDLNIVNNPWNNLPSPIKTTAKIIENGEYLYVAFIADDPDPSKIKGFLADRDSTWGDDLVGIKLDTYNNRRLDYEFLVNPYGVQNDSIANENTGEVNDLWDGIWQSYGKITEQGYQVEIAIPFNMLNFEQSDTDKVWAIELLRLYPRDERLRISHINLDRNNKCWLCQIPEIKGFKKAKMGKNIRLTPYSVAGRNQNRDIYNSNDSWHWGITASAALDATLNPDFSNVEADSGQLNVNKNFALFFNEKRPFFLENADYFSSNYNLVYTRNIADPDYGVKITGREQQHSYGFFATNDSQTNILLPGNLGSQLLTLNKESYASALNYRYNVNDDFSVGLIGTLRTAEHYHNLVTGVDGKYRIDDSNSVLAQVLSSNSKNTDAGFQGLVANTDTGFSDQAYKVNFVHESEHWQVNLGQQQINKNFRADLGFVPKTDFKQSDISIQRTFYGDTESWWSEANIKSDWDIQRNQANEIIEQAFKVSSTVYGPMLSRLVAKIERANRVGLRANNAIDDIDNNTTMFTEQLIDLHGELHVNSRIKAGIGINQGDKIDYGNNRLGFYREYYGEITLNPTDHFMIDLFYTQSSLRADNEVGNDEQVYHAKLTDLRLSYQFDVRSYLKLNVIYADVQRNPENNPMLSYTGKDRSLATQLMYSYKLNPQTVFFVGYSDSSYQDNDLSKLTRDARTFFTKISYAWMP